jgi:DNA (cytosine-5)-methyltransferase 1
MVAQPTAGTLGNRGLRSHTELDGHGAYIPVAFSQNQREEVREVEVPGALAAEPGTHQQTYIAQPVPYDLFQITAPVNRQNRKPGDPCHTLARDNAAHAAVAFHPLQDPISSTDGSTHCMGTGSSRGDATIAVAVAPSQRCNTPAVAFTDAGQGQRIRLVDESSETLRSTKRGPYSDYYNAMTVRRLTPIECEFLQGFPRNYTLIPWRGKPAEQCPDGPRYKALGNSMACNCMAWIGEKIAKWEAEHER